MARNSAETVTVDLDWTIGRRGGRRYGPGKGIQIPIEDARILGFAPMPKPQLPSRLDPLLIKPRKKGGRHGSRAR